MFHVNILHYNLGHSSFGIPRSLLVLTLSVANLCWFQLVCVQHAQVFCLLQAFQNVDHFQHVLRHL